MACEFTDQFRHGQFVRFSYVIQETQRMVLKLNQTIVMIPCNFNTSQNVHFLKSKKWQIFTHLNHDVVTVHRLLSFVHPSFYHIMTSFAQMLWRELKKIGLEFTMLIKRTQCSNKNESCPHQWWCQSCTCDSVILIHNGLFHVPFNTLQHSSLSIAQKRYHTKGHWKNLPKDT